MKQFVNRFNKENPDINVNIKYESVPFDCYFIFGSKYDGCKTVLDWK